MFLAPFLPSVNVQAGTASEEDVHGVSPGDASPEDIEE
jgi:hypothetical protein